jgi:serine/threonine protein kinase
MPFVGSHEVLSELGDGGMGTVKLGRSPSGRLVVLKQPHPGDATLRELLLDEARVGLRLKHPNIVETIDFFEIDGQAVLVIAFVSGASLQDLRAFGPLPVPVVARIGRQIAEALDCIHHATDDKGTPLNILHRDVTPANIMLGHDGEARLIDLGIAKHDERMAEKTKTGYLRGTLRYMAPEIFDRGVYSTASDLWALGVSLLDAALGRQAIPGLEGEVVARIVAGRVLDLRPGEKLDRGFEKAIKKLLHHNPAKRPKRGSEAAALFSMLEKSYGSDAAMASRAVVDAIGEEQIIEDTPSAEATELVASRATAMFRGIETAADLPPTQLDASPRPLAVGAVDADASSEETIDEEALESPFAAGRSSKSDQTLQADDMRFASQIASLGLDPDAIRDELNRELKTYLDDPSGPVRPPEVTDAIQRYAEQLRKLESSEADDEGAPVQDEAAPATEEIGERPRLATRPTPAIGVVRPEAVAAAQGTARRPAAEGVVEWMRARPAAMAAAVGVALALIVLVALAGRGEDKPAPPSVVVGTPVEPEVSAPEPEPEALAPEPEVTEPKPEKRTSRRDRRRQRRKIVHRDVTLDELKEQMPKCWAPGRTRYFYYKDRSGSMVAAKRYSQVPKYARKSVRCVD